MTPQLEANILAEQSRAEARVIREAQPTAPAISLPVPAVPFGYRVATIGDLEALGGLSAGTRVTLFDPTIARLAYGLVRGWSDDGVNIALLGGDIRLWTVDDEVEPLGASFPLTDGHYWLLMEVGR